jgi:hypothetical protein
MAAVLLPRAHRARHDARALAMAFRVLKTATTLVVYLLMLGAVLALWNNDAPQFIYVAF